MDDLILPLLDRHKPQIILVSYGSDAHWLDPLGQLILTADGYAHLLQKLCSWADLNCEGKIGLILEGGYDLNAGGACSLAVIASMLGQSWNDPYPCPYSESTAWQLMLNKARSLWNL